MTRNSIMLAGLLPIIGFAGTANALLGAYDEAQLNWTEAEVSGMRVDYPAGVFAIDLGPADKGPGRMFRSRDGTAGFTFMFNPTQSMTRPTPF
jgi:hypothetical protein